MGSPTLPLHVLALSVVMAWGVLAVAPALAQDSAPEPESAPEPPEPTEQPELTPEAPPETRVLITGFEPFGGARLNSSWEAVRVLDGQQVAGAQVMARLLPVVWDSAGVELARQVAELRPTIVIAFGVAEGEKGFRVERVARNENRGYRDNLGASLSGVDVEGAPERYDSTLPLESLVASLKAAGLPVRFSDDAGGYLCNQTFFRLSHLSRTGQRGPRPEDRGTELEDQVDEWALLSEAARPRLVGFVHVPGIDDTPGEARRGLPLEDIARGVRVIVEAVVKEAAESDAAAESRRASSGEGADRRPAARGIEDVLEEELGGEDGGED